MNSFLAFVLLVHSHSIPNQQSAVRSAAEEIVSDLDVQTKAMLIETPADWVATVFDELLGLEIRNRFGLHGGLGRNNALWKECSSVYPNTYGDQFAHQCAAMVLHEIVQVLRNSADQSVVAAIDKQLEVLEDTRLPEFNYFTDKDYDLTDVVDQLNQILESSGENVRITIDPDVLARKVEIGGGRFWEPVLKKRPRFSAENILDVLKRIKFELSTCLRRSAEVVWIGDYCSGFDGNSDMFSEAP